MDIHSDHGRTQREKENLRKRKYRYEQQLNKRNVEAKRAREAVAAEIASIRDEATREAWQRKERAFEEALEIWNSALVESEVMLLNIRRGLEIGIGNSASHTVLREARNTAKELIDQARAEAFNLMEGAQRESLLVEAIADQIVERARVVAVDVETQASLNAEEILRSAREEERAVQELTCTRRTKERDAARKRARYWTEKALRSSRRAGWELCVSRGARTARLVASELVELFSKKTVRFDISTKRAVCEKFWSHPLLNDLHPASTGSVKFDRSVAKGFLSLKEALQKIKGAQRNDHRNTKHNSLVALAGNAVVQGRYQTTLARALGIKRTNIYRASKRRALLDSDDAVKFPTGQRKERSDKISQEVRAAVEAFWIAKSRVSPRMKDRVRRRISKGVYETNSAYWLEDTEVEVYLDFIEEQELLSSGIKIGLRSFQYIKTFYICTLKDRNVCCCQMHVEIDLLKEALNRFRLNYHPRDCICICPSCLSNVGDIVGCVANKHTVQSVREWCEEILCPRQHGQPYHKKPCIMGNCSECGISKLRVCPLELDPASQLSITWDTFEYAILESGSKDSASKKPVKRLRMVKKTTSTSEFIRKLQEVMPAFVKHNFIARWQGEQYRTCLATFPKGTIVSSIDFSENYTFKVQNEVQSLHWDNKQITMLVLITRRHKDDTRGAEERDGETREVVSDYHFYISDDNKHDTLFVQHCLDRHWKWMAENNIRVDRHLMWSDGCAAQFKACRPFLFVSKYYNKYGAPMTWHFHGSGHGKDIGDGLGGMNKNALEREQRKGIRGHKLENAADAVQFLTNKFELDREMAYGHHQNARRFFWEVKVGEVDRSKELECLPIKGTRSLHCFHGYSPTNPTLLRIKELSCFCVVCVDDEGMRCANLTYTGKWKLQSIHPIKPQDVIPYADEIGPGVGQGVDWGEGSIADLIEVGDFFAVEAEMPNEFNADFWILQCTKLMYQLSKDHTDDYGCTFYAGDFALKGKWYQQWGRRSTCYVRYDSSPVSVVRALDVIHIKFALQPTGLVGGSPSFTLKADTLAEITTSLRRTNQYS